MIHQHIRERSAVAQMLRVLTGEGQGAPGLASRTASIQPPPAPTTLDGGWEEVAAVERRPPLEASSQAAVGRQPLVVVDEQRQGQSTNFNDGGDTP